MSLSASRHLKEAWRVSIYIDILGGNVDMYRYKNSDMLWNPNETIGMQIFRYRRQTFIIGRLRTSVDVPQSDTDGDISSKKKKKKKKKNVLTNNRKI